MKQRIILPCAVAMLVIMLATSLGGIVKTIYDHTEQAQP